MKYLSDFGDLPEDSPPYVDDLVRERQEDLRHLPAPIGELLRTVKGQVVDVGPGEGISSMALAAFNPRARVLGIEMDRKHLVGAWPLCNRYDNLELAWAAFGAPSNLRVERGIGAIPTASLPGGACALLFSWLGISRQVIFSPRQAWAQMVQESCVLLYPAFWRTGVGTLPPADLAAMRGLCSRLGIPKPSWSGVAAIPGFNRCQFFNPQRKAKARGWILWLTGLLDSAEIYLWDTLIDRGSLNPKFELPEIELDLEVALATH